MGDYRDDDLEPRRRNPLVPLTALVLALALVAVTAASTISLF